ncbi:NucA/NucB deoxyribonuclease domain-containing protein [Actinoplanes sp. NPDC023801]|uniref:NucA/NucB deoxyribonuclease domain-containing protein n=1 Tax=Actinoplanes sp. NPDC023801 TaxID=3154595 RepID=UPI00340CFCF7
MYSRGRCREFYGEWPGQLQNCDEYPFSATYEGSLTGNQRNGGLELFSVRIIDAGDNQYVGHTMLQINCFRQWRVLDGEQFDVVVDGIN